MNVRNYIFISDTDQSQSRSPYFFLNSDFFILFHFLCGYLSVHNSLQIQILSQHSLESLHSSLWVFLPRGLLRAMLLSIWNFFNHFSNFSSWVFMCLLLSRHNILRHLFQHFEIVSWFVHRLLSDSWSLDRHSLHRCHCIHIVSSGILQEIIQHEDWGQPDSISRRCY